MGKVVELDAPGAEARASRRGRSRRRPSKTALVLGGGGFTGGVYEIGALRALDQTALPWEERELLLEREAVRRRRRPCEPALLALERAQDALLFEPPPRDVEERPGHDAHHVVEEGVALDDSRIALGGGSARGREGAAGLDGL